MLVVPKLNGDLYVYVCSKSKTSVEEALIKIKSILLDLDENYIKENFDIYYSGKCIEIEDSKEGEGCLKIKGKYVTR